ncbi:poly(ethylene terephthalate) hydrolase family protein [Chondromyces apiculatus]|nr:hypothetical protein [Chondromyces apiculatus]
MPIRNSGFFVQSAGRGGFFVQGAAGRAGSELLVPLDGAPYGVAHHALDTSVEPPVWRYVGSFGAALGPVDAVSLIRSNFGDPGNLEAVACAAGRLALFWRPAEPGASWSEPHLLASGVTGSPALLQGTWGHRGHFELVAPLAEGGLGHWVRDNDTAGLPWHGPSVFGVSAGRFEAVTLIQGDLDGAVHLDAVARTGDRLVHFRCGPDRVWSGPVEVLSGVGGRPALVQGSGGRRGHVELVAPLRVAGVGHWYRDGDDPALPWRGPQIFATELGRCSEVSLLRRDDGPQGRIEAVVVAGDHVAHFSRDASGWFRRALFSAVPPPRTTAGTPLVTPVTPVTPVASPLPVPAAPLTSPPAQSQPEASSSVPASPHAGTSGAAAAPDRPGRTPRPGASPLGAGPYGAGFRRIMDLPVSRPGPSDEGASPEGHLDAEAPRPEQRRTVALLYYPAADSGEDAAVAAGAPFPVLALAHTRRAHGDALPVDAHQDYRQLSGLMAHLARRGFVVIAPDMSWLVGASPANHEATHRAAVLRDALAHLRAGSRGPILADFERLGLIGHGAGGLAALALALDRESLFEVRAAALLSPHLDDLDLALAAALPPTLVLRGAADVSPEAPWSPRHAFSTSPASATSPAASTSSTRAPSPRHLVTVPAASHAGYTTSLAVSEPPGGVAALPRREQQRVVKAYVTAFFEHYLRGEDNLAWLAGDAPVSELEGLSIEVRLEAP